MAKYVVLSRSKKSDCIVNSFGVYRLKRNAKIILERVKDDNDKDCYYDIEKVDPYGSFADDECDDDFVF